MPFPIYDKQEDVPEAFRSEYEEKGGKWVAKAPPAPEGDGLGEKGKETLKKERERATKAEREAKEARDRIAELEREQEAASKGISKEALDKLREDEIKARKPLTDENEALKRENRQLKLTDRLTTKLLAAGVLKDRLPKALKDIEGSRVDLTDDGKDFVVRDINGNPTTETVEDFLTKTYPKEAPFFYAGVNGSGSGAEGGTDGAPLNGYDPVKAGKDAAAAQKKDNANAGLALK